MLRAIFMTMVATVGLADEAVNLTWDRPDPQPFQIIRDRSGQPVFPRELYTLVRDEDFRIAAACGFNAAIERGETSLAAARRCGFLFTEANWFNVDTAPDEPIAEARRYRDESLLLAYNLNDEPDLRVPTCGPEFLAPAAAAIRREDPGALISVTLAGRGQSRAQFPAFAKLVDIIRVDPYPLVSGAPLQQVKDLVELALAAGGGKPVIAILQAWEWPAGDFPDGPQLQQMVFQSLIAGAVGISYFDWNFAAWSRHQSFWPTVIRMNQLIAEDLEPFLTLGRRWPSQQQGDVFGRLWQLPDNSWRLLLTRLGNRPGATIISNDLACVAGDDDPVFIVRDGHQAGASLAAGKLTLTMSDLDCIVVGSSPVSLPEGRRRGRYDSDLAGRPWLLAAADSFALKPRDDAYTDARLSLTVTGEAPAMNDFDQYGRVFRIFPGGRFHFDLALTVGSARELQLQALGWHDTRTWITGSRLAEIAGVQRLAPHPSGSRRGLLPARQRRQQWRVAVTLPATTWPTQRDHLLELGLSWQRHGLPQQTRRILRCRLEPPVSLDWHWSGALRCNLRFPQDCYPGAAGDLTVRCRAGDHQLALRQLAPLAYNVSLIPRPGVDELAELVCEVTADGLQLARQSLGNIWYADGRVWLPPTPKQGTVQRLAGPPATALDLFTGLQAPSLAHFLELGEMRFTHDRCTGWLLADATHLWWLMRCESPRPIRAEARGSDVRFLADDAVALLIQGATGAVYRVQANAAGAVHHAELLPDWQPAWNPDLAVQTRQQGRTWEIALGVPWSALGWPEAPAAGQTLAVNVIAGRSVAPRIQASWHPVTFPFDPAQSLAEVTME